MHFAANQDLGFGRINGMLGASSHNIAQQYIWDDESVGLKNSYFNEDSFRRTKLAALFDTDSCLSIFELNEILDRVLVQHSQLVLDISYAPPADWKMFDAKLNMLLKEAVTEAENQAQISISRDNIKNAQPLSDSWMSYQDVNAMLTLYHKRKFERPDLGKFVNRHRS